MLVTAQRGFPCVCEHTIFFRVIRLHEHESHAFPAVLRGRGSWCPFCRWSAGEIPRSAYGIRTPGPAGGVELQHACVDSAPVYPSVNTSQSLYNWAQAVYALHALSPAIAILGTAPGVATFLIAWLGPGVLAVHGMPSMIAVTMNYIRRSDAAGTWLESHVRWQIRTFWYSLLWAGVCWLIVLSFGIGRFLVWLPFGFVAIWFIYRISRGWLALRRKSPMYA